MKKLFVFLLALTMIFALAACGEKDPAPSGKGTADSDTTQTGDQGGESNGNQKAYDWPTENWVTDSMTWTGAGTIIYRADNVDPVYEDSKEVEQIKLDINNATIDDVMTYVEALTNDSFIVNLGSDKEPDEDGDFYHILSSPDLGRSVYIDFRGEGRSNSYGSYNLLLTLLA